MGTLGTVEPSATSRALGDEVLVAAADVLGEDDLLPFGVEEAAVEAVPGLLLSEFDPAVEDFAVLEPARCLGPEGLLHRAVGDLVDVADVDLGQ